MKDKNLDSYTVFEAPLPRISLYCKNKTKPQNQTPNSKKKHAHTGEKRRGEKYSAISSSWINFNKPRVTIHSLKLSSSYLYSLFLSLIQLRFPLIVCSFSSVLDSKGLKSLINERKKEDFFFKIWSILFLYPSYREIRNGQLINMRNKSVS
jgi:hypothetical protein